VLTSNVLAFREEGEGGGDAVTQFRDHIKLDEIEKVESAKDGASSLSYAGFF